MADVDVTFAGIDYRKGTQITRKIFSRRPVACLPILALLLIVTTAAPAKAQTIIDWNDPLGGSYNDILNWTGFNVPNSILESAQFNIVGTYNVTLGSGTTTNVSDLLVNNGAITFAANGAAFASYNVDSNAFIQGGDLTLSQAGGVGDVTLNVGNLMRVLSGSTVNVLQGSDVTAANLDLGVGGNGTMIVDGVGSSLVVSTSTELGLSGSTGTLTFQNGSTGNSLNGTLDLMAGSGQAGSTGRLNVLSGSTLQTGGIDVGRSFSTTAVQEGTLTVDGVSSSLTQTGASTFTVGDDVNPNVVSDVIISNSGVMSSGTGAILIRNSGHLNVSSGTFNANGNVTVDGGTITRGSSSNAFNLAAGLTLTASNNAQVNFGGSYGIDLGTTFDIQSGADFSTAGFLDIGDTGGSGTLLVDGAGSSATTASNSFWGGTGNTANVTFRNAATGILGSIQLARSMTAGTTGNFNIESGASVTAGTINITFSGGATTNGTLTVDGVGSTLVQNGASSLSIGHSFAGTATVNVANGGTFTTGTGTIAVNTTGTINVGVMSTGTFNANGNVIVTGGTITRGGGSNAFNLATGLTLTASLDAQVNFAGSYDIDLGTTFDIQSGADFSTTGFLDIGDAGGDGTLLVDGAGSSVTTPSTSYWGDNGNTANVTFRNAATGSLGTIQLARSSTAGTTGNFNIQSGASVTTGSIRIASNGGATTSGTITVDGIGSTLQNGVSSLTVGHASTGTATLNVQNGGTFTTNNFSTTVNTTGTLNVNTAGTFNNVLGNVNLSGTINLVDGTLNAKDLVFTGGTFNFTSGTLELNSNQTLDPARLAELSVGTLPAGKTFRINAVATLSAGVLLDVAGGTLDTAGLVMLPGSSLQALTPSTVSTGTLLASTATTIDATGSNMTLGDATAANGFYSNGNVLAGGSTLTLLDANDAVFDSGAFVTLGNGLGGAGTLAAANGLTLNFGGNVAGFGTVNTPNDPFKPLINNGNISGNSPAEPVTLTGYVKGVGTLNNVVITGTDAPGFSPATVYRGSVGYLGELQIELGGLVDGSFDIVNHSGTATLGGVLDLSLINGFVPSENDTFQFLTASNIVGTFNTILGTDLGGGLAFDVVYGLNDVTLQVISTALAGDLNGDGFVGINDLNIVLGNWNQNVPPGDPLADPSGDGFVGIDDLNAVLGNWNAGTPPGAEVSASIPEPASLVLLGLACAACLRRTSGSANPYAE